MSTRKLLCSVLVGAMLTAPLSGCFRYVPTELSEISPDQRVRVRVTDQELPRLRAFIDVRESAASGEFVEEDADSATFVFRTPVAFQELTLPRSSIEGVFVREVDKGRSLALSAGLVAGVGLLAWLGFEGRGSDGLPTDRDSDQSVVSILRLRLPF